jgi:hypothetical protein
VQIQGLGTSTFKIRIIVSIKAERARGGKGQLEGERFLILQRWRYPRATLASTLLKTKMELNNRLLAVEELAAAVKTGCELLID